MPVGTTNGAGIGHRALLTGRWQVTSPLLMASSYFFHTVSKKDIKQTKRRRKPYLVHLIFQNYFYIKLTFQACHNDAWCCVIVSYTTHLSLNFALHDLQSFLDSRVHPMKGDCTSQKFYVSQRQCGYIYFMHIL